jgi:hypothetical protein
MTIELILGTILIVSLLVAFAYQIVREEKVERKKASNSTTTKKVATRGRGRPRKTSA